MRVPIRLRLAPAAPTDAYLLPTTDAGQLATAVARLGGATAFRAGRGLLVVPTGDNRVSLAGAIRLRRSAGDVYLPADAALVPPLLPDEAVSLTRDRGLVFLPGEVLAFDPASPLGTEWLTTPEVRRRGWRSLPEPPAGADFLHRIERPSPPGAALAVLDGGQPDDADPLAGPGENAAIPDAARPPAAGTGETISASAKLAAGRMMAWLGRLFRSPKLARAGGNLVRKAIERVPRLSECVLGAQEAALREVLRQLQSGDVEAALRRAPRAVADPADGTPSVGTGSSLAAMDPRYSLRNLIDGGRAVAWLGGGDVWALLAAEYRRLAAEAEKAGDFRRAAYLHGVLLRDLRSAAAALLRGGLYRDAAVLFRDKLTDYAAAADAFRRAGETDEAVHLYERLDRFEDAGDALRDAGEEDAAVRQYRRAAVRFLDRGQYVTAGDLLRVKAGDRPAAAAAYRRGWDASVAEWMPCGERLLRHHVDAADNPSADAVFAEALARLAPPHATAAGRFVAFAGALAPDELRPEWDDRSRLLLADHLRAGARADALFVGPRWPGPVVRDATFASRKKEVPSSPVDDPVIRLASGTVVAVTVARDCGDLIVATTTAVVRWRPDEAGVAPITSAYRRTVLGLSATADGGVVYLLCEAGGQTVLHYFADNQDRFRPHGQAVIADDGPYHLQPAAADAGGHAGVHLAHAGGLVRFRGEYLRREAVPATVIQAGPRLVVEGHGRVWCWSGRFLACRHAAGGRKMATWVVPWLVGSRSPTPDWLNPAAELLEVTGTDEDGNVYWAAFDGRTPASPQAETSTAAHPDGYAAACLIGPGLVAAVTARNVVDFLRASDRRLVPWAKSKRLAVPSRAAFAAARPAARELAIVFEDGTATRVPLP